MTGKPTAQARHKQTARYGIGFNALLLALAGFAFATDDLHADDGDAEHRHYRFGVFPHLPPSRLEQIYRPIALEFKRALHHDIEFRSTGTYEAFADKLADEYYDIAFLQPFDYVWAHDQNGYQAVARRSESLTAIFIVKHDSPLRALTDLQGKVVAHPPRQAAVSMQSRRALRDAGFVLDRDVTTNYYRSHYSCFQQVLINAADACVTARQALRFSAKKLGQAFDIIHETPPLPHTLFAIHKRVPAPERKLIQDTILNWPRTQAGKRILANGRLNPFVLATDDKYDVIRRFLDESNP